MQAARHDAAPRTPFSAPDARQVPPGTRQSVVCCTEADTLEKCEAFAAAGWSYVDSRTTAIKTGPRDLLGNLGDTSGTILTFEAPRVAPPAHPFGVRLGGVCCGATPTK